MVINFNLWKFKKLPFYPTS